MKKQVLLILALIIFHTISFGQGKIDKAEDSLKKEKKTSSGHSRQSSGSSSSGSSYSYTNNNSDDSFAEIIGGLVINLFAYTAYGIAFESPFEMDHKGSNAFLTKYPYKNGKTGNYSYDWNKDTEIFTTAITNRFLIGTDHVYGNHLNVDMRFLKRFGLELDYLQLWEKNSTFGNNNLGIYTALAKYNRVRTERFNASWGLGIAYVDGDVDDLGFAYGLGAELFFAKPLSLETNFNGTTINGDSVNKFNAFLNYYRKQYKFALGYENLKIGSVNFSNFVMGIGVSL